VIAVEGNLCWVKYGGAEPQPFIWRVKDGLNNSYDWPTKLPASQLSANRSADTKTMIALVNDSQRIPQLYMQGHSVRDGYVVSLVMVDAPPVRFYRKHPRTVRAIVERFNRMQVNRAMTAWNVTGALKAQSRAHERLQRAIEDGSAVRVLFKGCLYVTCESCESAERFIGKNHAGHYSIVRYSVNQDGAK
jgi:hypothetical protein